MKLDFQCAVRKQCLGNTKSGNRCQKQVFNKYCFQHEKQILKNSMKGAKPKPILMRKRAVSEPITYKNELTIMSKRAVSEPITYKNDLTITNDATNDAVISNFNFDNSLNFNFGFNT
eukprot:Pgem_evm1s984